MLDVFSPFAIQFTENFGIRWYGLAYLAGFIVSYYIARIVLRNESPIPSNETVSDFIFAAAVGTVVGGRLGYCVFYQPSLFTQITPSVPFWGVLALNDGGMASHGGIVGIIIACLYFARSRKLNPLRLMDIAVLGGCVGVFLGRIANFINGELYGRVTTVPWGMRFPRELYTWSDESLAQLAPLAASLKTQITSLSDLIEKSIVEARQGNPAVIDALNAILPLRHPSQLYEAGLEGLLLGIFLVLIYRITNAKAGECTKYFFIAYGVVRIIGEQYRMPDAHIGFQIFDLTRGQILSFFLVAVGVVWKAIDFFKRTKE